MAFHRASKKHTFARVALLGPAGSGKTYTALRLAHVLAGGRPIAVFDTERGSASKYAGDANPDGGRFDFLVMDDMPDFAPRQYIKAIEEAEKAGCGVLIFDSLSHAWSGPGGILEFVDTRKAGGGNNQFAAWRDATPLHNQLVDALLNSRMHLICTMRTKMEYVLEEDSKGKKVPRKVGMQPVQREGVEYEFDVIMDLDQSGGIVSKSRCSALAGRRFHEPGADVARLLAAWLSDSAAEAVVPSDAGGTPSAAQASTPTPTKAPEPTPTPTPAPKREASVEDLAEVFITTLHARVQTWPGYEQFGREITAQACASLIEGKPIGVLSKMIETLSIRSDDQLKQSFSVPLANAGAIPF